MKLRLSDIYELQMGKTPARNMPEFWNGTNAWVSISDLTQNSKYISQTKECITDEAVSRTNIKKVPKDTLLMSFKLSLGKVAITATDIYTNEAIMAFIDKKVHDVDIHFMYHYFQAIDWTIGTNKAVKGITLNKSSLSEKVIELPPIQIQRKIAEHLDKLSAVEENIQCQLSLFDKLVKSQFVELFGDLAFNPHTWKTIPLVDACTDRDDIKCGPFGTQLGKHEYTKEGIPLWGIPQINASFSTPPTDFITEKKSEQLEAYSILAGDIAMSRKGNVGKCAIYPQNFSRGIIHSDVLRIRLNHKICNPYFMMHQLHFSRVVESQIDAVSSGAVMAGINVTKLKNIFVHIPPLDLQNEFAALVEQADKSEFLLRQLLEKQQTLKKALMQEYFS